MSARTMSDVVEEYLEGMLAGGEVFGRMLDVMLEGAIDAQLSAAPPETRDWMEWGLHCHYAPIEGRDADSYISIFGGTVRDVEAFQTQQALEREEFRRVTLPRLQAWCRGHAPPAREAFPLAVVRGLYARIAADCEALWARRPPGWQRPAVLRAWAERPMESALSQQRGALETVMGLAARGGAGSLDQAVAWMGFERIAPRLAPRDDLSAVELELVSAATQRREAHLEAIGRSPPGARGVIPDDLEP